MTVSPTSIPRLPISVRLGEGYRSDGWIDRDDVYTKSNNLIHSLFVHVNLDFKVLSCGYSPQFPKIKTVAINLKFKQFAITILKLDKLHVNKSH